MGFVIVANLDYLCKANRSNVNLWQVNMPVYGVFVLDFTLPELGEDWLVSCEVWNKKLGKPLTGCVRWKYIQLPNFGIADSELCGKDIEKITYLINNMGNMTTRMPFIADKTEYTRMEELCRLANLDTSDRLHYERELKYYRDKHNQLAYAEKQGIAKGIEQGMAKGMAKGMAQGMAQGMAKGVAKGRAEGRAEVIRTLVSSGMSVHDTAKLLKMPEEEVREMAQ